MEVQLSHLRASPLPLPARGGSARFQLGRRELVLERGRGAFSLLCLDGTTARSWSLGLTGEGELWLACRVPRWPLRIALQDTLVLTPGGRVRGFVQAPLVPTLLWRVDDRADAIVAELLPSMLQAAWDDSRAEATQRWTSPFFQRLPPPDAEPRAVLPLTVRNDSQRMQSPESLPVSLRDHELAPCRGHLVAAPRRLRIGGDDGVTVELRGSRTESPA